MQPVSISMERCLWQVLASYSTQKARALSLANIYVKLLRVYILTEVLK